MSEKQEVQLLDREDCLKALHNSYVEKFVGACLSERFYQHRLEEPKNGDDIEKVKAGLLLAQDNIEYNELMLRIIDEILDDPKKVLDLGKVHETKAG